MEVVASFAAHPLCVRDVAFSHDGKELYTASDDQRVSIWDVSSGFGAAGGLIASIGAHNAMVLSVAAAPSRHTIATAGADRAVKVWDARRRECVHTWEVHGDKVWSARWNAEGTRVASVSEAGTLAVHAAAQ
jgi:WD40 repeat protein